jgi:hypothetical protein
VQGRQSVSKLVMYLFEGESCARPFQFSSYQTIAALRLRAG